MAPPGEARPLPRDARTIALIASSMGIQEVETSALVQLLDFCHRYTYDVLQDAMVYADHANSGSASRGAPTSVSLEDVQLAVQSRVNYSFTPPPSKEMQLALATAVNSEPLPLIGEGYGIRLPPRSQRLTATSFNIIPNAPPLHDDLDDEDEAPPPAPKATIKIEDAAQTPAPAAASGANVPLHTGRTLEEESDYDEEEPSAVPTHASAPPPAPPAPAPAPAPAAAPSPAPTSETRGVKRQLEEDDDYD